MREIKKSSKSDLPLVFLKWLVTVLSVVMILGVLFLALGTITFLVQSWAIYTIFKESYILDIPQRIKTYYHYFLYLSYHYSDYYLHYHCYYRYLPLRHHLKSYEYRYFF